MLDLKTDNIYLTFCLCSPEITVENPDIDLCNEVKLWPVFCCVQKSRKRIQDGGQYKKSEYEDNENLSCTSIMSNIDQCVLLTNTSFTNQRSYLTCTMWHIFIKILVTI